MPLSELLGVGEGLGGTSLMWGKLLRLWERMVGSVLPEIVHSARLQRSPSRWSSRGAGAASASGVDPGRSASM